MKCRMCLLETGNYLEIFGSKGIELQISQIVTKHFWFEPTETDPISKVICEVCWEQINIFHEYYRFIEIRQKSLEDSFGTSLKSEENNEFIFVSNTDIDQDEKMSNQMESTEESESNREIIPREQLLNNEVLEVDPMNSNQSSQSVLEEDNTVYTNVSLQPGLEEDDSVDTNESFQSKLEQYFVDTTDSPNLNEESPKKSEISDKERLEEKIEDDSESDDSTISPPKLKCSLCSLQFTKILEFSRHFRLVHKERYYLLCCDKKISRKKRIIIHLEQHMKHRNYRCFVCSEIFSNMETLQDHKLKHFPKISTGYSCVVCSQKFDRKCLLYEHKATHKSSKFGNFSCDECGKSFPLKKTLKSHTKWVHSEACKLMCDICGKIIKGRSLFNKHVNEHNGIIDQVKCEECGNWMRKHTYISHRKKHLLGPQVCSQCGKTLGTMISLQNHIKEVHEGGKTFQCSYCPRSFKRKQNLNSHVMSIHLSRKVTCPHCSKKFTTELGLYCHTKVSHKKEWEERRKQLKEKRKLPIVPNSESSELPKEGTHVGYLDESEPEAETEINQFGENYTALCRYIRKHFKEEDEQKCPVCETIAPSKSALVGHVYKTHSRQRTHECSVCKKTFKWALVLKEHMAQHTGVAVYSCPYCPAKLRHNGTFSIHKRKFHKKEWEEELRKRKEKIKRRKKNVNKEEI